MSHQTWDLQHHVAKLAGEVFEATYDAAAPARGLEACRWEGRDLGNLSLLGVRLPGRPENDPPGEVYVRADDLVAQYPPRQDDLVSHQIYYRPLHETSEVVGIELLLSVQTSLLESDPRIQVINKLGAGQLLVKTSDGCQSITESREFDREGGAPFYFLMRLRELPSLSLVLLVHPSDFFVARASLSESATEVVFWVFPESLEKGVIRRGVFRNLFVPRSADEALAQRLLQRLDATPPSLAT